MFLVSIIWTKLETWNPAIPWDILYPSKMFRNWLKKGTWKAICKRYTHTHTHICTFVIFLTAVFRENENFASLGDWSLQYYVLRKILFYWQKYPKTSSSPIRTLLDIKMMRIILLTHDIDPVITKVSKNLSISMSFIED